MPSNYADHIADPSLEHSSPFTLQLTGRTMQWYGLKKSVLPRTFYNKPSTIYQLIRCRPSVFGSYLKNYFNCDKHTLVTDLKKKIGVDIQCQLLDYFLDFRWQMWTSPQYIQFLCSTDYLMIVQIISLLNGKQLPLKSLFQYHRFSI